MKNTKASCSASFLVDEQLYMNDFKAMAALMPIRVPVKLPIAMAQHMVQGGKRSKLVELSGDTVLPEELDQVKARLASVCALRRRRPSPTIGSGQSAASDGSTFMDELRTCCR